jgi:hypothetical protein
MNLKFKKSTASGAEFGRKSYLRRVAGIFGLGCPAAPGRRH